MDRNRQRNHACFYWNQPVITYLCKQPFDIRRTNVLTSECKKTLWRTFDMQFNGWNHQEMHQNDEKRKKDAHKVQRTYSNTYTKQTFAETLAIC